MTAQRPNRPSLIAPDRLTLEVSPDFVDRIRPAAERELGDVPVEVVVALDLPAGVAARISFPVELAHRLAAELADDDEEAPT